MENTKSNDYITFKKLLTEKRDLLCEVIQSEEDLREMIIKSDFRRISETQAIRDEIEGNLIALEDKRNEFFPTGTSMREHINNITSEENEKQTLNEILNNITEQLSELNLLNSVNKDLLREKIWFIKEMRQVFLGEEDCYTAGGQVKNANEGDAVKVNRIC